MANNDKPVGGKVDVADYVKDGGDLNEAMSDAVPMVSLRERHKADIGAAREAIREAFRIVGSDDSTRQERTATAQKLVEAVPSIAWLAVLEPAEWATASAGLATGTSFGQHTQRIRSAVTAASKGPQRELAAEGRAARNDARKTGPASRRVDAFIPKADPSVLVQLDRKIRMVDGVPEPGAPKPSLSNLAIILTEDPTCREKIRYNAFACVVEIDGVEKRDDLDTHVAIAIHRAYDLEAPTEKVREALGYVAKRYGSYDPLVEYLDGVTWDGVPRIATMLQDLFAVTVPVVLDGEGKEVEAPGLLAAMSNCFMIGLVARAYEPGCKLDTMPVLVGLGGRGKSRGIAALCPRAEWFCDTQIELRDKDRFQQLDGVWIYEHSEMDMMSNAQLNRVKGYTSSSADKYRRPYDRTPGRHPRRTGFCGSTNDREFGQDRRFHPVDVSDHAKVNADRIAAVRDQLWAEAVALYRSGVPWHLSEKQAERMHDHAEKYRVVHPWEPSIGLFLADTQKVVEQRDTGFHVSEVMAWLDIPVERRTDMRTIQAITKIVADLGCRKARPRGRGKRPSMWFRPE